MSENDANTARGGLGRAEGEQHELISASTMKANRGDSNLKVICLHCKPKNSLFKPSRRFRAGSAAHLSSLIQLEAIFSCYIFYFLFFQPLEIGQPEGLEHEMQNQIKLQDVFKHPLSGPGQGGHSPSFCYIHIQPFSAFQALFFVDLSPTHTHTHTAHTPVLLLSLSLLKHCCYGCSLDLFFLF